MNKIVLLMASAFVCVSLFLFGEKIAPADHPDTEQSPYQTFIIVDSGETAPPEATNAYTSKQGGAQPLPNADPDVPIVVQLLD
ncbi:MAG TPA: hypothetical protein VFK44_06935 [Bacillales bacterium]|nr:hypothetical protein [Bacillales bacterium]